MVKYRSSLRGIATFVFTTTLLATMAGCRSDTESNSSNDVEVYTQCITESLTTTLPQTHTTSTTSHVTTTSTTTTTETVTATMTEPTTTLTIATQTETTTTIVENEVYYSEYVEDDVILLAKLINHEASATYEGKVMVGSCVVNRMNMRGMTVSQVIFEPGQFTTASDLLYYNDSDYQAALQVLTYGSADSRLYYFDGCHPDGLNHFRDINNNFIGAW